MMNHGQIIGGAIGSTMTQPTGYARDVPQQANPIPAALGLLGTAIHETGVLADLVANRLTGVMQPTVASALAASGDNTLKPVAPVTSPTADEITSLRRRVENIGEQLRDVLSRLEV